MSDDIKTCIAQLSRGRQPMSNTCAFLEMRVVFSLGRAVVI